MKRSGNENVPCFTSQCMKWWSNRYGTFHFLYALPLWMTTFHIGVQIFSLRSRQNLDPLSETNFSKVQNESFRFHFSDGSDKQLSFRFQAALGEGILDKNGNVPMTMLNYLWIACTVPSSVFLYNRPKFQSRKYCCKFGKK